MMWKDSRFVKSPRSLLAVGLPSALALALLATGLAVPSMVSVPDAGGAPSASAAPYGRGESAPGASGARAVAVSSTAEPAPETEVNRVAVDPADPVGDAPAVTPKVTGQQFTAAGVTWTDTPGQVVRRVQVRVLKDGVWGAWTDQEVVEGAGSLRGTEPVLINDAQGAQARIYVDGDETPRAMKMAFVSDGGTEAVKTSATSQSTQASQPTPTAKAAPRIVTAAAQKLSTPRYKVPAGYTPKINPRSSWGPDEKETITASQNERIDAFYVHHTAGSNNYKNKAQAEAQIRSDWAYHTEVLKWGDLGYHIMIDKFGNIYEGRRGSLDSLPLGTHAAGFNTNTYAVSLLGNYEITPPSKAMMASLRKVLAWKAYQYGVDVTTSVKLTSHALPGSTSRYKAGTTVTVPRLVGHTTTSYTACPGKYVIPKLPQLRRDVAADVRVIQAAATPVVQWKNQDVADYLKLTTAATGLYVQPSTKAPRLLMIARDKTVTVTHKTTESGWLRIKADGNVGYVRSSTLGAVGFADRNVADYYKLTSNTSPIYRGANPSWGKVATLKRGTQITITHATTRAGWYRIKYAGGTGYLWKSHLDKAPGFRIVDVPDRSKKTVNTTPLYRGAGTSWGKVATVKKGSTVKITHNTSRSGWYRVKYSGGYAYLWRTHVR